MESLLNKSTLTLQQDHIYDFFEEVLQRTNPLNNQQEVIKRAYINGLESLSNIELSKVKLFMTTYSKAHTCPICKNKNIRLVTDFIYVADFGMCPVCDYESDTFIVSP